MPYDFGFGRVSISYVDLITGERMEIAFDTFSDHPDYYWQKWDDMEVVVSVNVKGLIHIVTGKRKAIVQVNDATKTYGDTDPEFTYAATGVLEGDELSIGFEREPGEDAGEYVVRPVLSNDPESNNNKYTIQLVPAPSPSIRRT